VKLKHNIPTTTVTRDLTPLIEPTGNLYQTVVVIGKRARDLAEMEKQEISRKLSEFNHGIDNLEEVFENREQIEASRQFERMPKPIAVAIDEFLEGKIKFRTVEKEDGAEA
jgi:DNA-directed RNA polymerase subunit K/omega